MPNSLRMTHRNTAGNMLGVLATTAKCRYCELPGKKLFECTNNSLALRAERGGGGWEAKQSPS